MEHSRIDEGVKRGPRKKSGPKPSSPRHNNGQFIPKLSNDPEDIRKALESYISGSTLKEIGDQFGVTRQAVYGWLLGELGGQEHSALVTRALTARIAKGDETLDLADNPLDLQRGREQARNARLDLERRRSSLYGAKQEVSFSVSAPSSPTLLSDAMSLLSLIKEQRNAVETRQEKLVEGQVVSQEGSEGGGVGSLSSDQPPGEKE